eukprot:sb/3478119/
MYPITHTPSHIICIKSMLDKRYIMTHHTHFLVEHNFLLFNNYNHNTTRIIKVYSQELGVVLLAVLFFPDPLLAVRSMMMCIKSIKQVKIVVSDNNQGRHIISG